MSAARRSKSANKIYDHQPAPDNQADAGAPSMVPPVPAPSSPAVDTPTPFLAPDALQSKAAPCAFADIRQGMHTVVYHPKPPPAKAPPTASAIISQQNASVVTAATPGVTTEVITGRADTPPPPPFPPKTTQPRPSVVTPDPPAGTDNQPHVPHPVVVVACCAESYEEIIEQLSDAGIDHLAMLHLDLRDHLIRDPNDRRGIGHMTTGNDEHVQTIVIGQTNFDTCVISIIKAVEAKDGAVLVIVLNCNKGQHRAITAGRTLQSGLNYIQTPDNQQKYACLHFSHLDYKAHNDYSVMAGSITAYLDNPSMYTSYSEPTLHRPIIEQFGFAAAIQDRYSAENWMNIWEWLIKNNNSIAPRLADPFDTQDQDAGAAGSDGRQQPAPSDNLWVNYRGVDSTGQQFHRDHQHAPNWRQDRRKGWYEHIDQRGRNRVYWESSDDNQVVIDPICKWNDYELPPWAQLQKNARVWWGVLDHHRIDELARQQLFLLGDRDHLGYAYANDIISKLSAHKAGHYHNASNFVHSSVANARKEISSILRESFGYRNAAGYSARGFYTDPSAAQAGYYLGSTR